MWALALPFLLAAGSAHGQKASVDLTTPPSRPFHDARSGVSFQIPSGWNLSVKDGEVSTLRLDARSAAHDAQMRALVSIGFNPFPESTFSGAFFYFSVTPRLLMLDCTRQATAVKSRPTATVQVGDVSFQHGYDEHSGVCTEARDEIYTATRNGACYRFDLIINNFCGGEVSGVRDITPVQIEAVRKSLEAILSTVHFE